MLAVNSILSQPAPFRILRVFWENVEVEMNFRGCNVFTFDKTGNMFIDFWSWNFFIKLKFWTKNTLNLKISTQQLNHVSSSWKIAFFLSTTKKFKLNILCFKLIHKLTQSLCGLQIQRFRATSPIGANYRGRWVIRWICNIIIYLFTLYMYEVRTLNSGIHCLWLPCNSWIN